ncbi:hypothetical protein OXIME_000369 [Oxyplasma meridianum]|uniref:Uncharacterized protein n=1 Tax=Oxyplasma meridianum TaxID=3073602 RepID=A0AAX4NGF8_9ARCH
MKKKAFIKAPLKMMKIHEDIPIKELNGKNLPKTDSTLMPYNVLVN